MIFRQATTADIPELMRVRMAVKENRLSNPGLVTAKDCEDYLVNRGRGWVCERGNRVLGFAIVDLLDHSVWALFVEQGYEGKGIGRKLHDDMLNWYFSKTGNTIWLTTGAHTRAATFYLKAGWWQTGIKPNGELKFEMRKEEWKKSVQKT